MSREKRLARLGLTHLKDDPAALLAEIDRLDAAYDQKVSQWKAERDKRKDVAPTTKPTDPGPTEPVASASSAPEAGTSGQRERQCDD